MSVVGSFAFVVCCFHSVLPDTRLVGFLMAVDDNARREYLAQHVSSDLQYIWQEADVALATQYE